MVDIMEKDARKQVTADTKRELRKLWVNYEKTHLYSSLACQMRRRGIPRNLMGYDILLGVVFGKIRHPEITIEEAIQNSVNACKLPGSKDTVEDGIFRMLECIEVNNDIDTWYEEGMSDMQVIEFMVETLVEDIRKEYCYTVTITILGLDKTSETLSQQIIKNMLFKKLVADESTWECMLDYATKKLKVLDEEIGKKEVLELAQESVPEGKTLEDYISMLVEKAYKF